MVLNPRSVGSASIHVYHLLGGGERLELVHKTPVDEIPSANVHSWEEYLLELEDS